MSPIETKETRPFGEPEGWDAAKRGPCHVLPVEVKNGCCISYWAPNQAELAELARGGVIRLSVVGGQPPVHLGVVIP